MLDSNRSGSSYELLNQDGGESFSSFAGIKGQVRSNASFDSFVVELHLDRGSHEAGHDFAVNSASRDNVPFFMEVRDSEL